MKHFFLTLVSLVLFLVCFLVGASFFLKSTVESMASSALSSIASPGEVAIGSIEFSPLARTITITELRTHRADATGPHSSHIAWLEGQVSLSALLACLPGVGDFLHDEQSLVPIFTEIKAKDITISDEEARTTAATASVNAFSLRYPLFRQYLAGNRPPFAQAIAGIQIENVVFEQFTKDYPALVLQATAQKVLAQGIVGTDTKQITLQDSIIYYTGQEIIRCKRSELKDVHVTPALFSEIVAYHSSPAPLQQRKQQLLRALEKNGAIFHSLRNEDLVYTNRVSDNQSYNIHLALSQLTWHATTPVKLEMQLRSLRIPAQMLQINWQQPDPLIINADASSVGLKEQQLEGIIRIQNVTDVTYSVLLTQNDTLRDFRLVLKDYGLMARIGKYYSYGDPEAMAMLLKLGVTQFCSADTSADKVQCQRLSEFMDRPGTLELSTPKGREVTSSDLMRALLSEKFGSLFTVTVQPGAWPLSTQIRQLPN